MPPLTALVTFEAVARLGSFTRAASELGVTQAAVSRQIHLLEETFGFPLFDRLHRRVELTRKGAALSASATNAFNMIAETLADITGDELADELVISASVAVSQFWLLPRIAAFSRLHPHIRLRIVTQNGGADLLDGEIDLALRFGDGMWPDGQAEFLFDDEIFPVCSPKFAEEHLNENTDPAALVGFALITSHAEGSSWTGWAEWLAAFSVQLPKRTAGIRCSFYTEEIQAALNGQGIALGWRRLVADHIRENRLVRVTGDAIRTRNAYFVVIPKRRRKQVLADQFIDWLKTQASLPV